mmetsp:Transcript_20208/g.68769  ORF Transcript_20208/g.68769 Transcript_20208/m.68769 type:complete len:119 (-) Transcript_20208:1315-1671(-)
MSDGSPPPGEAASRPAKEPCGDLFNALYSCYSPVHQMKHVYRRGHVDDCNSKAEALWDCLQLRTSAKNAEAVAVKREGEEQERLARCPPYFTQLRTREEAAAHWRKSFPDLQPLETDS